MDEWRRSIVNLLPSWSAESFLVLSVWQWMGIGLAIFLGLVVQKLVYTTLKVVHKIASSRTRTEWDDKIVAAFIGPTGFASAVAVWYLSIYLLALPESLSGFLYSLFQFLASVAIVYLGYRLVTVLTEFLRTLTDQTESDLDDQLMPIVDRTLKSLVVIIGGLIIIQNMGINVLSAIAGLGIGGLAFALAARDTAANIFGSITIFLDRPFKMGDWVRINDAHEGIVEAVGMRTTRIRTFKKTLISLPNSVVANSSIENISARANRRVYTTLGILYGTPSEKIERFVEEIRTIIRNHERATDEGMQVSFVNYNASSLDIMVYFFVNVANWTEELQAKQDVYLAIMRKAEEMGIGFAFPTQTIHLEKGQDG